MTEKAQKLPPHPHKGVARAAAIPIGEIRRSVDIPQPCPKKENFEAPEPLLEDTNVYEDNPHAVTNSQRVPLFVPRRALTDKTPQMVNSEHNSLQSLGSLNS